MYNEKQDVSFRSLETIVSINDWPTFNITVFRTSVTSLRLDQSTLPLPFTRLYTRYIITARDRIFRPEIPRGLVFVIRSGFVSKPYDHTRTVHPVRVPRSYDKHAVLADGDKFRLSCTVINDTADSSARVSDIFVTTFFGALRNTNSRTGYFKIARAAYTTNVLFALACLHP